MKVVMSVEPDDVNQIPVTLQCTLTVGEWRAVAENLRSGNWVVSKFWGEIYDAIRKVEQNTSKITVESTPAL